MAIFFPIQCIIFSECFLAIYIYSSFVDKMIQICIHITYTHKYTLHIYIQYLYIYIYDLRTANLRILIAEEKTLAYPLVNVAT